jgi:UDP-N-acetylmuramoylalanine--D-glutamate ligase
MKKTTEHILHRESVDPREARSICVLGRRVTGEAVAEFFRAQPDPPAITVYDDGDEVAGSFDLAIASPGIPPYSPLVASVRECARELISEPELAWRLSPERWIVITGTNGKTTTTALTAHLLNTCGMKARVAGNIGTTCIEAVRTREPGEYLVVELSSYQLAYSRDLVPVAAALLNITPDHLAWHGTFGNYRDAKLGLFDRMEPGAPAVIDATLEETRAVVRARRAARKRTIPIGTAEGLCDDMTARCGAAEAAFVDPRGDMLTCVVDGERRAVLESSELKIKGEHNQENALAAAAVVLALGADPAKVAEGLASFEPLEHRIEPCGSVGDISFFNDSKATNPEATCKALAAFGDTPLVVMLGGRDKGTSLDELIEATAASCRAVVCYGEAGSRFAEAFEAARSSRAAPASAAAAAPASAPAAAAATAPAVPLRPAPATLLAPDFRSAFDVAVANACAGDVVLLSPACASFDAFSSYEQRGTTFKALVVALREEQQDEGVRDGD